MKKIEFQSIGDYDAFENQGSELPSLIRIRIKNEFKNALVKLNHFSHCLVLTKDDLEIFCYSAKIIDCQEKTGELVIEVERKGTEIQGELVDIKPYFPCEEVVEDTMNMDEVDQEFFALIPFQKHPIGEYLFVNHHGMIQMRVSESLSGEEIEKVLGQLKAGDYIRVLWWFHKFDDHKYRSHLMCNPPYKNAPKIGGVCNKIARAAQSPGLNDRESRICRSI